MVKRVREIPGKIVRTRGAQKQSEKRTLRPEVRQVKGCYRDRVGKTKNRRESGVTVQKSTAPYRIARPAGERPGRTATHDQQGKGKIGITENIPIKKRLAAVMIERGRFSRTRSSRNVTRRKGWSGDGQWGENSERKKQGVGRSYLASAARAVENL